MFDTLPFMITKVVCVKVLSPDANKWFVDTYKSLWMYTKSINIDHNTIEMAAVET